MPGTRDIRADFDANTIVVYQAYGDRIAEPALAAQRFVPPFSFERMTWIKPSLLWLMHRSNWGAKKDQTRTLRVRISRAGWDRALALGVLTSPDGPVFGNAARWERDFAAAPVHVQWDTERSLRGAALDYLSIQVGLGRQIIRQFVDGWVVGIEDVTPTVAKMKRLLERGKVAEARRLLPANACTRSKRTLLDGCGWDRRDIASTCAHRSAEFFAELRENSRFATPPLPRRHRVVSRATHSLTPRTKFRPLNAN